MKAHDEPQNMIADTQQNTGRLFAEFAVPTYEQWKAEAEKALKGASFESRMITKTYEGIDLQPIYRMEDIEHITHHQSIPSSFPFVRGTTASGYLSRAWDVAQACSEYTPETFNQVLRTEMERGVTVISIVLDTASRRGLDPASAEADQVGDTGLSLATIDDLNQALTDIGISDKPISVYAGMSSCGLLALFSAFARANGIPMNQLQGCIGADPVGELVKHGAIPCSLETLYDEMAVATSWTAVHAPHLQTIFVQAMPYHDGGGNAIQELAFALATAVEYVKALQERGMTINEIAPRIRFGFSLGANVFMEISKLRAARLLWAQVVEILGGDAEAQKMHVHARTSAFTKTLYDPYVNMLRTTTEAFSGAVGGVDSLYVAPFDESIRPSDEFSRRVARNTQIMLQQECNMLRTVDPAGGSYYIENLTHTLAEKTWALFQEIDEQGGMVAALQREVPQALVAATLKQRQSNLGKRKDIVVGTNMYANLSEKPLEFQAVDRIQLRESRMGEIAAYRGDLDMVRLEETLRYVKQVKSHKGCPELMEAIMEAAFNGATLGEITGNLRSDCATMQIKPVGTHRLAEQFEFMRQATEAFFARTGKNLRIFLANMGPIPQHKARADFSAGFFEVAGFQVLRNEGFGQVEEAVEAAVQASSDVVVICSTDKTYPELVPPLAAQLKEKMPGITVILAGLPAEELQQAYKEAGVDEFIHVRADCYKILFTLQKKRGMLNG